MASYDVSDFTIEMNPDGDRVRLKVTSQIYPAGKDLGRWPLPQLDLEALRRLRQDEALPGDVAAVQQALATWLFDERLAAVLQAALAALAGNRRLRLVLSIAPPLWSALGELPFELLPWGNVPLLLHQRVASLVYVSPDAGSDAPLDSQTPLRILLVRSRPDDLDPVPEAAPLRDDWLALGRAGNSERPGVQVDLVSREPGALGPATWDVVRQRLKDTRYHLLVYLGHGEVTPSASGPTGALLFEAPPDSQEIGRAHV